MVLWLLEPRGRCGRASGLSGGLSDRSGGRGRRCLLAHVCLPRCLGLNRLAGRAGDRYRRTTATYRDLPAMPERGSRCVPSRGATRLADGSTRHAQRRGRAARTRNAGAAAERDVPTTAVARDRATRCGTIPRASHQPCLVSQKILLISSILASSWSAVPTSVLPLVPAAPASFVASLKSWCS